MESCRIYQFAVSCFLYIAFTGVLHSPAKLPYKATTFTVFHYASGVFRGCLNSSGRYNAAIAKPGKV